MTNGARVMDSTPPPMNTSPSPTAIAWAAELIACSPEPHSRLTVRPPTSTGRPARSSGHPGDVAVVLAGLVGAAEDDVLDERRVDAGPVDDGAQDERGEVVRPDAGERAAVAADRRADGLDDPGLAKRTVGLGLGSWPRRYWGAGRDRPDGSGLDMEGDVDRERRRRACDERPHPGRR